VLICTHVLAFLIYSLKKVSDIQNFSAYFGKFPEIF
jgi:hypothetical protein